MALTVGLTDSERRTLVHLMKNRKGNVIPGKEATEAIIDATVSTKDLVDIAKISETEHYNVKNRYRHQRRTLDYADKKRMPTDERTVRDMLRNQHIVRWAMEEELPTYEHLRNNRQFEYGLLQYLFEGSCGELAELVKEVGIKRDSIPYMNVAKLRTAKDNLIHESDIQFSSLQCALFTPLDMTDHETEFVGWNEVPAMIPFKRSNWLARMMPESHPQVDALASIEEIEDKPRFTTSPTFDAIIKEKYADPEEEEEEEFYGQEIKDDDDYEDEEGGEEDYGDYGDYEEEVDDDPWPPAEVMKSRPMEDRFFRAGESLRGRYNEVEIDNFLKLLGVKARSQWQDTHSYHHKQGLHQYEDEG